MPTPRIPVHRRTRRIVPADIDELGHVNNVVWVRFVVEVALAHFEAFGFGPAPTRELGGQWVVRRHDVHYLRSALPDEEIREETWVSEMRGARSVRHTRFRNAAGNDLVTATSLWAFTDLVGQRPRRIPREILDCFDLVSDPD